MITRATGIVFFLFIAALHAEISAPPALKNPSTSEDAAAATPEATPPSPVKAHIPSPIAFESLNVEVDPDVELAPSLASSAASVGTLENEMDQSMETGDLAMTEKAFNKLLKIGAPPEQKREAILKMARYLEEKQKAAAKAAVVYEQYLSLFPDDATNPEILLRLGRIYRDTGAYASALNKFYAVLYSSLQLKSGEDYTDSSLRAKMEIAHTHFAQGDYKTAAQLYSRLKLIKMSQTEASEVAFRSAYIAFLSGDFNTSLSEAQSFLATYPASPIAPEAQYLIVQSLKSLGRKDDAMKETIKLLQAGKEFGKKKPAIWAYWQRKTGNEIANELYESGDAVGALSIYQRLAELDENPNWRGSTVYQIGLCFERLRHLERAREAYQFIIDKIPVTSNTADNDAIIGINLATLREMAQWRISNLAWLEKTEKDVALLLDKQPPTPIGKSGTANSTATPASTPIQTAQAGKTASAAPANSKPTPKPTPAKKSN